MKVVFTLLLVAALGGGGWFLWTKQKATATTSNAATARPSTATLETRSIRFAVTAAGEITPSEQVSVRPEVNGRLLELPVDIGDSLKKDQLLFQLDDKDLQIEKQSQETAIARARLELEQADRDYRRAQQLYQNKLIALELFEDARTKSDLARNTVERNEKALDLVQDKLRKTRVTAPFECTVLTRPVSVGQAVSGSGGFNSGTEILTIANLNDLIINAHVNQADITRLHVEQDVEVSVEAVPGLKVLGKVERLAPQATIKNNIKGFAARILLKNVDRRIRPGMTANISIPVASADNVVAAPLSAIFTEMNQQSKQTERYVFVKKDDEWERRSVEIGVSDLSFVEVTRGLSHGEIISLEDRSKSIRTPAASPAPNTASNGKPATPSSPSRSTGGTR